jgi:Tfp pilus assembly pilus retraction ATPase PilT
MPRFHLARLSFAREKATLLKKTLAEVGVETTLTKCRQVIARLYGYRDFHELTRVTEDGGHAPSALDEETVAPDLLALVEELDIGFDVAVKVLDLVRPRAMGGASHQRTKVAFRQGSDLALMPVQVMGLEKALFDNIRPRSGLFLLTGPTGMGKSAVVAAIVNDIVHRPNASERVFALSHFTGNSWRTTSPRIEQTTIESTEPDAMAHAVRNALRRAPTIISVDEVRDASTFAAVLKAATTGHMVYTTMHSIGVSAAIRRLVQLHRPDERAAVAPRILEAIEVICSQNLVPAVDGTRIALREFLIFDAQVKARLGVLPMEDWPAEIDRFMADGHPLSQTMREAAKRASDRIGDDIQDRTLALWEALARSGSQRRHRLPITASWSPASGSVQELELPSSSIPAEPVLRCS